MMSILVKDMLLSILHISLAMLSIIIISLLLAVNPTVSLLSLGAVAATIVDTAGFAYFWGLTFDPFLGVICSSSSVFGSILENTMRTPPPKNVTPPGP